MTLPASYVAYFEANPISRFSVYTDDQIKTLRKLAEELTSLLDSSMSEGCWDGQGSIRAYSIFWLWVLGAYEVIRTISQAGNCFSTTALQRIKSFKQRITQLRIPFAKQEYAGRKPQSPIRNEASIYSVDTLKKDFSFEVKGAIFSVRNLLTTFEELITSIKPNDVLDDHRQSRSYQASNAKGNQ
jgi:hypothetical protein